jgi:hypothetical protein
MGRCRVPTFENYANQGSFLSPGYFCQAFSRNTHAYYKNNSCLIQEIILASTAGFLLLFIPEGRW